MSQFLLAAFAAAVGALRSILIVDVDDEGGDEAAPVLVSVNIDVKVEPDVDADAEAGSMTQEDCVTAESRASRS